MQGGKLHRFALGSRVRDSHSRPNHPPTHLPGQHARAHAPGRHGAAKGAAAVHRGRGAAHVDAAVGVDALCGAGRCQPGTVVHAGVGPAHHHGGDRQPQDVARGAHLQRGRAHHAGVRAAVWKGARRAGAGNTARGGCACARVAWVRGQSAGGLPQVPGWCLPVSQRVGGPVLALFLLSLALHATAHRRTHALTRPARATAHRHMGRHDRRASRWPTRC